MDVQEGQGSPESPSTEVIQEVDPFEAHLAGGGVQEETQPVTPEASVEVVSQTEEQPQEPQGRAEQRIQELIRQNTELNQKAQMADQLQMFIASNPQARAAYEEALGQGATQEQAQQAAVQTQQAEANELPEWDPFNEEVVAAHKAAIMQEAKREVLQELQPILQFVEQMQTQQLQTEVQSTLSGVQESIYAEIPTAKENAAHFTLAKGKLLEQIQTLPPEYQQAIYDYEYLNPNDRQVVGQVLSHCVKEASKQAKELINQFGVQPQQVQAQEVPKPFSESGTNLVAPRPSDGGDPFLAHIQRHS